MKNNILALAFVTTALTAYATDMTDIVYPEQRAMNEYVDKLKKLDVEIAVPDSFTVVDMRGRTDMGKCISSQYHIDEKYNVVLESPESDAFFFFPEVDYESGHQIIRKGSTVEDEIRYNKNDLSIDIRPLIEIVADEDMSRYSNADTAVVYELEFDYFNDFLKHNHCVGVYLRKASHPAMLLKIVMNDEGYEKKDIYVRQLLDCVRYGDNGMRSLQLQEKRLAACRDLDFPSPAYKETGIVVSPVERVLLDLDDDGGLETYKVLQNRGFIKP